MREATDAGYRGQVPPGMRVDLDAGDSSYAMPEDRVERPEPVEHFVRKVSDVEIIELFDDDALSEAELDEEVGEDG